MTARRRRAANPRREVHRHVCHFCSCLHDNSTTSTVRVSFTDGSYALMAMCPGCRSQLMNDQILTTTGYHRDLQIRRLIDRTRQKVRGDGKVYATQAAP